MSTIQRNEVAIDETWNLDDIFSSEQAFEDAIRDVETFVDQAVTTLTGNITDAASVVKAIAANETINEKLVKIGTYANLSHSVDQTNSDHQMRAAKVGQLGATIATKLSFVKSDLLSLDETILKDAQKLNPAFANYIEKLLIQKPYQLHPEAEKALAAFGASFSAPYELYNTTKLVDMNFPHFEVDGEQFPLSYNSFEGDWELESDPAKRHAAFEAFYKK